MATLLRSTVLESGPSGWGRFTLLAQRWLLPAAAGLSVALGIVLIIRPSSPVGAYVPIALLAIGLGAIIASFAPVGRPTTSQPSVDAPPIEVDPRPAADDSPSTGIEPGRSASRLTRRGHRGSEWRVLAAPTDPGDETWLSWLPREHRGLGGGGLRFARVARYTPGQSGGLVALPAQNPDPTHRPASMAGVFAGSAHKPVASPTSAATVELGASRTTPPEESVEPPPHPATARRYSEEDLDRMFPDVADRRGIFLVDVPDKVGVPEERRLAGGRSFRSTDDTVQATHPSEPRRAAPLDGAPLPTDVFTETELPEGFPAAAIALARTELNSEAANPTPPHLRDSARGSDRSIRGSELRSGRRSPSSPLPKTVCASCSKVVVNLRMSGPCPHCLRPICNDCLREAFVAYGHGWCIDCAAPAAVRAN